MKFYQYHNRPGLEIIFNNGKEDLSLFYVIYEWPAAQKFYTLVKESIESNHELASTTAFAVSEEDGQSILDELNKLVIKINNEENLNIPVVTSETNLNHLHQVHLGKGNHWRKLNWLIHDYEQFRSQHSAEPRANATFTFLPQRFVSLSTQDKMFFKTDREYGDLCLDYTLAGKHWLEAQGENDIEAISNGSLQPEINLAPAGYLLFRQPNPSPFYRLHKFLKWYNEQPISYNVSYDMALGYLLLGKLVMPENWNQLYVPERGKWTEFLCRYKNLSKINLIDITSDMVPELIKKSKMPYV